MTSRAPKYKRCGGAAAAEGVRAAKFEASGIPEGKCQCGCGGNTKISRISHGRKGLVAGKPNFYLTGHGSRRPENDYTVVNGCWVWNRPLSHKGYGTLHRDNRTAPAHRFFYEKYVGPIPDGYHVDHLCWNRACVNPAHLEAVPASVNSRRSRVFLTPGHVRLAREFLHHFPGHE